MTHHYLLYNGHKHGPYLSSDAMFTDLARLVMVEKPKTPARWLTVTTDDPEPGNGEEGATCKHS